MLELVKGVVFLLHPAFKFLIQIINYSQVNDIYVVVLVITRERHWTRG